jgi:hypothetical protein
MCPISSDSKAWLAVDQKLMKKYIINMDGEIIFSIG